MIYYGDEAGLEGYTDPFNRLPYPWGKENLDLINYFSRIGKIRLNNIVYQYGAFKLLLLTKELLLFSRSDQSNVYLTIMNNTSTECKIKFDCCAINLINKETKNEYTISPEGACIYKLDKNTKITVKV